MPAHEPWYLAYERDVLGEPGKPWPTRPRPVPLPEPPARIESATAAQAEPGAMLLGLLLAAICAAVAAVRR
ncbi:hypothetical protein ACQPW1_39785 [Nocardia sp. CA-128927]|uniref:hypothetical protein n=1 Tax=Nocardia sp. CA-128927 TaxID=3239975 RepID=UPI003D979CCD